MQTQRPIDGPWYRHFWPWFIVALLGSTVAAGIATVVIAVRGADALVVDDYYRDGKAINRSLAADREAARREAAASLRWSPGEGADAPRVETELEILGEWPPTLVLTLSHATRSDLDRRFELAHRGEGHYAAAAATPRGRYYVSLAPPGSSPPWRLRGHARLPHPDSLHLEPQP
ncbi:MAG: FixH family protein [Proteobacteria bacterium]|nr:FixH family protein [Pseudomonadota bacterium]